MFPGSKDSQCDSQLLLSFFFACFSSSAVHWALRATIDNPRVTETEKYTKLAQDERGGEITEWDEVKRFYKKTALRGEFRSKEKKEEWQKSMHLYWVKWEKRKSDLEDFSEHCPPPLDGKMQLSGKQWHYLHMYSPWKRTRERFYNSAFCCPLEAPLTSLRHSRAVTHTEKFISALGQKGRWVMNMRKWKLRFSWKPTESCIKENNEKNESF